MHELSQEEFSLLATRMLKGTISDPERLRLEEYLNSLPDEELVWESGDKDEHILSRRLLNGIRREAGIVPYKKKKVIRLPKWRRSWSSAAASIMLLSAGIGAYLWLKKPAGLQEGKTASHASAMPAAREVPPGTDKAVLTLSDGRQIELAGSKIITDGAVNIQNIGNELVYAKTDVVAMNTMTTPRGGQYRLSLPDGSRVWLNAGSSITFPTSFGNGDRKVEMTGEAYFEVAQNKSKPFSVHVNGTDIQVLGTAFNVNAYTDESSISATLLEGSIVVKNDNVREALKVGQQARVLQPGRIQLVEGVNLEQTVAWKNGFFSFNRTPLTEVLRQVSRWYDIDVVYDKAVPDLKFGGELKRDLPLSDMLDILQKSGVHFRLESKKLMVFP